MATEVRNGNEVSIKEMVDRIRENLRKEGKLKTKEELEPELSPVEKLKKEAQNKIKNNMKQRWYLKITFEDFRLIFEDFAKAYHYKISNSTFELKTNPDFEEILQKLYDYITNTDTRGLYLWGWYGTGKTMTVTILADMLKIAAEPKPIEYELISATELIDEFLKAFQNNNKLYIEKYKTAQLLIIDDLGSEKIDEINWFNNKIRPIHTIIEHRYKTGKPTWFTSNYSLEELQGKYSGYIIDRMLQMCYYVHYTWDSYRN